MRFTSFSHYMNKQQLAARIWAMANDMRSKIAANEYKDFILWFMFYKFLWDKELEFLRKQSISPEEIRELSEDDQETVNFIKTNLGYFIGYNNLFSTWTEKSDFDISEAPGQRNQILIFLMWQMPCLISTTISTKITKMCMKRFLIRSRPDWVNSETIPNHRRLL